MTRVHLRQRLYRRSDALRRDQFARGVDKSICTALELKPLGRELAEVACGRLIRCESCRDGVVTVT